MNATRALITVVAGTVAAVAGQQAPELPTFRVAVDIVSIDVVATDRDGRIVRDLTPEDFEVFQDGKQQRVTAAQFVPVSSGAGGPASVTRPGAGPSRAATEAPPIPTRPIPREQVRRTIVLVVDDLGLSSQGMRTLLPALRRFVEKERLPTDVMAIVRTGESNGLMQSLTNDRSALHGAIDALRYNVLSRKGPWSSGDVVQLGFKPPEFDGPMRPLSQTESLSALNLIVQSARDLPGRKTVIFASEGFQLTSGTAPTTLPDQDPRVRDALDRVTDQAARSGVVLYAIDCTGLETGGLRASDDIHYVPNMTEAVNRFGTARQRMIRDAQQSLAFLTEQTGGFAVVNTNDLADGLSRIGNDVRDYYLLGYEPDKDTFASDRKLARQHTIAVKVRRPGVRVRTRRAFIGVSDPERPSAPPTPAEALVRAAMSPFSSASIGLHVTNLPAYSAERGTFVRSVLHLDGHALTFSTDGGGTKTATVDLVGLMFDSDGAQVQDVTTGFNVTLENRAVEQVMQDGLVYTTRVPIEKPGGYQLRFAVRDRRSGAIGAGGGFVLVPNVTGGDFALSGLVLRAPQRAASAQSLDGDGFSIPPVDALRVYAPGTPLVYSFEVYNAGKKVGLVATLWRGEEKLATLPAERLAPHPNGSALSASGRLTLPKNLQAGTHVLQVAATSDDPNQPKKDRSAVQRISFDVK
jgi:VWFA-related protein